nr:MULTISPECIES: hypothetical protein [Frankia]
MTADVGMDIAISIEILLQVEAGPVRNAARQPCHQVPKYVQKRAELNLLVQDGDNSPGCRHR